MKRFVISVVLVLPWFLLGYFGTVGCLDSHTTKNFTSIVQPQPSEAPPSDSLLCWPPRSAHCDSSKGKK
jgi:hypothetical protein